MIASKIKVGQEYAMSNSPRKGITDLFSVSAQRVTVTEKGVQRWAENVKDTWGHVVGGYKDDGIKGDTLDYNTGTPVYRDQVYKARDFLMPWEEYKTERDRRAEVRRIEVEAQEAKEKALRDRHEAVLNALESYGLNVSTDRRSYNSTWEVRESGGHDTEFSLEGAEKLLQAISERIYEAIKNVT